MLTGFLARRWSKSPKLLHMISLQEESLAYCWLCPFSHYPLCTTYGIKTTLENNVRALFTKTWSPHAGLSLTFWLNSHLERGGSSSLLIMPELLRSDLGGLSVSSPLGERKDACGLHKWCKLLVLKFYWSPVNQATQPLFSTEFSYWAILISAAFLHWISSLSYPCSITLCILN